MAGKFVDLQEAAKMIGVSTESLVEMRSKGAIFGYRDGGSWKFKVDEVERVIRERGVEARDSDSGILNANDDEFENLISGLSSKILADKAQEESEPGAVLISEQELGVSATGQSTIIGKGKEAEQRPSDSDLRLADDSSKDILGGGSDKLIEAPGNKLDLASASDVLHGSDIHIQAGSGTGEMPASKKAGSSAAMNQNDLQLGEEDDIGSSDSALEDDILPKSGSKPGSSGKGSDVTLGSGDSGINLSRRTAACRSSKSRSIWVAARASNRSNCPRTKTSSPWIARQPTAMKPRRSKPTTNSCFQPAIRSKKTNRIAARR